MKISIVIPTLNEADNIGELIEKLRERDTEGYVGEIIVADGGSDDGTETEARTAGARVVLTRKSCRALQMNAGADTAQHEILYFVHADTLPPVGFSTKIIEKIENGYDFGCFRVRFKSPNFGLRMNSYLSRFRGIFFRGGDETLFLKREFFARNEGFSEKHVIMEDYEIILRMRKKGKFCIIGDYVLVSDRKVRENNYFRANSANVLIFSMFFLGFSQETMVKTYRKLVKGTRYKMPERT